MLGLLPRMVTIFCSFLEALLNGSALVCAGHLLLRIAHGQCLVFSGQHPERGGAGPEGMGGRALEHCLCGSLLP